MIYHSGAATTIVKSVLLVADKVWPRLCKIGYGLRQNGVRVVLLHRFPPSVGNTAECFDEMIRFEAVEEAASYAIRLQPYVIHIFSCWNFDLASFFILNKVGTIVFDDYDVFAGVVRESFATQCYPGFMELERYCLENAHGITCRDMLLQVGKKQLHYNIPGRIIYFPDYCWNKPVKTQRQRKYSLEEMHLVFAGNIAIEKNSGKENPRDNIYLLEFARDIVSLEVHFHVYPAPNDLIMRDFENQFSEHLAFAQESPYYHLHRPVPADQLIEEIAAYDLGLLSWWTETETNCHAYNPIIYRQSTSNKLFDYLDAGLGIILAPGAKYQRWLLERNGVAFAAYLEHVREKLLSVEDSFWTKLPSNVARLKEEFAIAKHSHRLIDFYRKVVETNRPLLKGQEPTPAAPALPAGPLTPADAASDSSMPNVFAIETTLACNLRCPECAIGGGMVTRKNQLMTFDQYQVVADKIRPYATFVYLHIWGEPMLNPDIIRMIHYTAPFARTNISTNAISLSSELAEQLILSGVAEIIVSIDGVSQEVYAQYRVGGNAQQAFAMLETLHRLNIRYGGKVSITPQFIVFKHNQHEAATFQQKCLALGLTPSFKPPYIRTKDSRFAYSDYPQFHRPHYRDVPSLREAMGECQNPRNVFTVLVDGSVVACCHDYAKETCFGNIFTDELPAIWNAPAYRAFRESIVTGNAPAFCIKNCMTYFLAEQPEPTPVQESHNPAAEAPAEAPADSSRENRYQQILESKQNWHASAAATKNDTPKEVAPMNDDLNRYLKEFHRFDLEQPDNREFFVNLINNPQLVGLRESDLLGKTPQQRNTLILAEYFAKVGLFVNKLAGELLFNGQWGGGGV